VRPHPRGKHQHRTPNRYASSASTTRSSGSPARTCTPGRTGATTRMLAIVALASNGMSGTGRDESRARSVVAFCRAISHQRAARSRRSVGLPLVSYRSDRVIVRPLLLNRERVTLTARTHIGRAKNPRPVVPAKPVTTKPSRPYRPRHGRRAQITLHTGRTWPTPLISRTIRASGDGTALCSETVPAGKPSRWVKSRFLTRRRGLP